MLYAGSKPQHLTHIKYKYHEAIDGIERNTLEKISRSLFTIFCNTWCTPFFGCSKDINQLEYSTLPLNVDGKQI